VTASAAAVQSARKLYDKGASDVLERLAVEASLADAPQKRVRCGAPPNCACSRRGDAGPGRSDACFRPFIDPMNCRPSTMKYLIVASVFWALSHGEPSFAEAPRCPAEPMAKSGTKVELGDRVISPGVFRLSAEETSPAYLPDFSLIRDKNPRSPMELLGDVVDCADDRSAGATQCFKFFLDGSESRIHKKQLLSPSDSHDIKYRVELDGGEQAVVVESHPGQKRLADGSLVESFSLDLEFGKSATTPWGKEHIEDIAFQPEIPGGSSQMYGLRRVSKSGTVLWSYVYLHKAPGAFVSNDSAINRETILSLELFNLLDAADEAIATSTEATYCKTGRDYRSLGGTAFEIDLIGGLPVDRKSHVIAVKSSDMASIYQSVLQVMISSGELKETDMPIAPSKFAHNTSVRSMAENQNFSQHLLAALRKKYFSKNSNWPT
jgi:hypothetical protein